MDTAVVMMEGDRVAKLLPDLDAMIGGGLVTLEPVRVVVYRYANPA